MVKSLSKRDALDLVIGSKILANGGGGSEQKAIGVINSAYHQGHVFRIASLDEFESNDQICIVGMVGGGISEQEKSFVKDLKPIIKDPMISAVKNLEGFLDVEFKGFVATELGPLNSIIPLTVASLLSNKMGIDGDCCGRSKPQISISTTTVGKISISPFSISSEFGDELIVSSSQSDIRGEVLARTISKISNGSIGVARCPMKVHDAVNIIIPQTLSLAVELGRRVREANEKNKDPITEITKTIPTIHHVMKGTVKAFSRREEGGFTSGEILIIDQEEKKDLRIYYKNEYLLTWLNNNPFITCPDSFPIVDSTTGYGLTPWEDDFSKGREVEVFAIDAPSIWQSNEGLRVFGPKVFDPTWEEYIPASKQI